MKVCPMCESVTNNLRYDSVYDYIMSKLLELNALKQEVEEQRVIIRQYEALQREDVHYESIS